jgi:uncharacterized tellurite resistance protein B-like protein
MEDRKNYQLGLLYLVYLLIGADGVIDEQEKDALLRVKKAQLIPDSIYKLFEEQVEQKKEREIYQQGIDYINECTDDEKLNVFGHLYKMSEVDGRVHVKEVRLLLYSMRQVGIEFDEVVQKAATIVL